jgi:hypothetical protein
MRSSPLPLIAHGNIPAVHSVAPRQNGSIAITSVELQISHLVRKCFCDVSTCVRKIFAERLTPFVEPLARVTARLFQVVQAIGLATGGMLGARLAERLGIKTSWMTVLRWIMAHGLRNEISSSKGMCRKPPLILHQNNDRGRRQ